MLNVVGYSQHFSIEIKKCTSRLYDFMILRHSRAIATIFAVIVLAFLIVLILCLLRQSHKVSLELLLEMKIIFFIRNFIFTLSSLTYPGMCLQCYMYELTNVDFVLTASTKPNETMRYKWLTNSAWHKPCHIRLVHSSIWSNFLLFIIISLFSMFIH